MTEDKCIIDLCDNYFYELLWGRIRNKVIQILLSIVEKPLVFYVLVQLIPNIVE